jgi:long-chain fatty acid transport protein
LLVVALLVVALCGVPRTALAGGYGAARFGGEHGTVVDTNPSAVYYNPGAVGFDGGHELMVDFTLILRRATYTRPTSAIDPSSLSAVESAGLDAQQASAALAGKATLHDVLVSPFAGVSSDLGLDSPLRLGAAFFVPFGGQSAWDETAPDPSFPGAQDGTARWYNIEGVIRSMALGFVAAYKLEEPRLSFGLGLDVYFSEVDTLRARNANGTDNLVSGSGSLAEGRSLLQVSGTHLGLGAGVLWETLAKRLWLGASYQSAPGFGAMVLEGTLDNVFATGAPAPSADVQFTQALPDVLRLGARFRPHPSYELRLVGDWTRWSRLDQMCIASADVSDAIGACATNRDGSLEDPSQAADVVQVFQRRWRDSVGVKAAVLYFIGEALELNASLGYDSNSIPAATLDAALFDMDKIAVSLGGGYDFSPQLRWTLTLSDVIYFERDTGGVEGNESLAAPSRQPGNQGRYTQNIFLINTGLQVRL